MDNNKDFSNYIDRLSNGLKTVDQSKVNELFNEILSRVDKPQTIHLLGNGGSAANASHICGDYTKSLMMVSHKLNIQCWSDSASYLTATANDIDYSEIYSSMIGTYIKKGDLIVYFSGSGNSLNLVKCAREASEYDIKQAAIVGFQGGALKDIVNLNIHSNCNDMEISEDIQLIIFHHIKQKILEKFLDKKSQKKSFSAKYDKRLKEGLIA